LERKATGRLSLLISLILILLGLQFFILEVLYLNGRALG
jgi:hypothetical protein